MLSVLYQSVLYDKNLRIQEAFVLFVSQKFVSDYSILLFI